MDLPALIGLVGAGCYLGSYWMVQTGRWGAGSAPYAGANLAAAAFTLVSLTTGFNIAALINNSVWFLISGWVLARAWRRKRMPAVV